MQRRQIRVEGIVQGVGFRPFVFRLAQKHKLAGLVFNDSHGVLIEIEGQLQALDDFRTALENELPPLASINHLTVKDIPLGGEAEFRIIASQTEQGRSAQISPDTHVCEACLVELFDPADRRYRYPFINCTNCGPRYTIVTDIPYDRPLTTMVDFPMCPACLAEYEDPTSRRFHAQPNACPDCGPQLSLHDETGAFLSVTDPLASAISRLKAGEIVAVKGLGGYHLVVDASQEPAVRRLRQRKHRDEKPFALMSFNLERVRCYAQVSDLEERLLTGVERPIVLLPKRAAQPLAEEVAPNNNFYGFMLPYTPLHYLLLEEFTALVMTSGNRSDEPISYENAAARERLRGIADCYLQHNRRIHIRTDDSIARMLDGQPVLYRRSRGYVPRGVRLSGEQTSVLAVGAELKNTICLTRGDRAYLSQHIGDLKNQPVIDSMRQAIDHFQNLLKTKPQRIAHDLHPDYASTRVAEELAGDLPLVAVQHHHAHLASCLADNGWQGQAIGVIFDGIGYGSDGQIWGGEFLVGDMAGYERLGQLAYHPMPGGDAATKEPWRMALSYLHAAFAGRIPELDSLRPLSPGDRKLLLQMIEKRINSPLTSSVGRLFDAVAALVGVRQQVSYEGQAALELEMLIDADGEGAPAYPFAVNKSAELWLVDPAPMIRQLVEDLTTTTTPAQISARFHNGLAQTVVVVCRKIAAERGLLPVALSGGVFQNRYLAERTAGQLREAGFDVLLHRQVPPNDGGLSLGQAAVAGAVAQRAERNPAPGAAQTDS